MNDRFEEALLELDIRSRMLFGGEHPSGLRDVWLDAVSDPLHGIRLVRALYAADIGLAEAKAFVEAAPVYLGSWTKAQLPVAFATALLRPGCVLSARPKQSEPARALHLRLPADPDPRVEAVIEDLFPNRKKKDNDSFFGYILARTPPAAARIAYLRTLGVQVELRDV